MRIAQVPPLYEAVPPRFYGGTERVVAHLTDALVDLGHDVTLFASGDARTKAELVVVRDQAIRLDPAPLKSDLAAHMAMLAEVRAPGPSLRRHPFPHRHDPVPDVRGHGRQDADHPARAAGPEGFAGRLSPLAAVSAGLDLGRPAQAPAVRQLGRHGAARHGEDIYDFHPKSDGYLAFLGRISPEKGPDRAIAIAKRLGKKLKIAAKSRHADRAYFHDEIEPLLWTIR
jgi:glycosyltransferase involved in cell wall biosynthesis